MKRAYLAALLLLAATQAPAQQAPVSEPRDCPACPDLALVPPGQFQMGSTPDAPELEPGRGESPAARLSFARPFMVSVREVTHGEFRRFVEATGAEPAPGCRVWSGGQWIEDPDRSWRDPGFATAPRDDEPVVCVSWEDARAYAEWLSAESGKRYRLPSEAEWEYVARGGTSFPRYWGENDSREDLALSLACDFANVYDASAVDALRLPWPNARCSDRATALALAAQYKPNAFGVHDIIGNAREWVMDCFTASYAGRPTDARAWIWQGGCEQKGVRGGSFASRPRDARAPARGAEPTGHRQSDLGFRVARDF
ncbi:MAG: formylglycine-generating enzyme family protein [Gammaproteobacteria bacterium]|nr:formylglycine-generating enzyme family protein [Gammaproteobacteria bacterium]